MDVQEMEFLLRETLRDRRVFRNEPDGAHDEFRRIAFSV